MTSKLILMTLLMTTLLPAFASAHVQCTYGDFANGCVYFGSWSYGQGCSAGAASNYAGASFDVGGRGVNAVASSYCYASHGGSNNTTSSSEFRGVQAYGSTWGPRGGHGAGVSWQEWQGAWENVTYEDCGVFVQAGPSVHDRACPADLAPPAVPAILP